MIIDLPCGKTAGKLMYGILLSYSLAKPPWQDHGEYARYPFNAECCKVTDVVTKACGSR